MSKSPKTKSPEKGFLSELAAKPKPPEVKAFTWDKRVATTGRAKDAEHTIQRLSQYKAIRKAPQSQQIQKQYDALVAKRKGEK